VRVPVVDVQFHTGDRGSDEACCHEAADEDALARWAGQGPD